MISLARINEAANAIAPHIIQTPIHHDEDNDLYIKLENRQITGSFKVRGALNKVMSLSSEERSRGLVAASAGNHGQGLALAANLFNAQAIVFASEHAVPSKLQAMRRLGADVRLVPGGYAEAERAGIDYARDHHAVWVSPYNDVDVIAGQGTVGLEMIEKLPKGSHYTVVVPTGGGGLAAGIGIALDQHPFQVVAVQSDASAFMHHLYHYGSQDGVADLPSLADGLSGEVEPGSITISLVKKYIDDFVLVSEDDISSALIYAWINYHERIEGSAAVALAAVLTGKVKQRPAVVVFSGGNIQPELHAKLCKEIKI